ncbi:electron transfer flavoprotein subunit alpha/FixB family protein [Trinickia sp.]|uniref:electron transfer flavoprotein subunit alpha/FixB family protein n=1 Tax=Trinickia sp. TaxID=2571163 RepID=UPI003F815838
MTVLVIAEHDNSVLHGATPHVVEAARRLSGGLHLLIAGRDARAPAVAAAQIAGVDKVLLADAPHLAEGLAENIAAQVLTIAATYTHILFPATAFGKSIAPRVAARLDVAQISDVIAIDSDDTFQRPIFAGNAVATVQSSDAIKVATIRTTAFGAAQCTAQSAEIESIPVASDTGLSSFVRREILENDRPELTAARAVVSGGRGLGSADNFRLLEPLAQKLGAAIGASRAAVDSGFAPNDLQVGQTGKIVAPELYVAVGISGAIQHLAGMRDSKVIVAINKDAEAPIFGVADYGLVCDLFDAVPELTTSL